MRGLDEPPTETKTGVTSCDKHFAFFIDFRYPALGAGASFKAFKVHAPGVRSVCFLDKGIRSQQVISVGGKDRCVAQVKAMKPFQMRFH